MIRLVGAPSWTPKSWRPAPARGLGQVAPAGMTTNFQVVVIDVNGTPVAGALVTANGGQATYTDDSGIARFSIAGGRSIDLTAKTGEYAISKTVQWESADIPAYISFPIRIQTDIVKTAEMVAFVAGVGLIGAGYVWKLDPLKIVGEIVTGAIVFAMIYRLAGR